MRHLILRLGVGLLGSMVGCSSGGDGETAIVSCPSNPCSQSGFTSGLHCVESGGKVKPIECAIVLGCPRPLTIDSPCSTTCTEGVGCDPAPDESCGNGSCAPTAGENCKTCPSDCGCIPEAVCSVGKCIPRDDLGDAGVDTGTTTDDTAVGPEDTFVPPEDTYLPPEDTFSPPEDTWVPPEDTAVPDGSTCTPSVGAVSPLRAILGYSTDFNVTGACLPASVTAFVPDCTGIATTWLSPTSAKFNCTPSYTAGAKAGLIKDAPGGTLLKPFTLDVCIPSAAAVSPSTATLGTPTTFTITGTCIPPTIAAFIPECAGLTVSYSSMTSATFSCTPSYTTGVKAGFLKAKSGDTAHILDFSVNVVSGCTPSVSSITPSSVTLGASTTFTIKGTCLPSTTAVFIPQCASPTTTWVDATTVRTTCTPSYASGSKSVEVKNTSGGTAVTGSPLTVTFNEPTCAATVSGVTPTTAKLGTSTTFTIAGSCMPTTIAPFIPECAGLTVAYTTPTNVTFSCTPSYTTGSKAGSVKDKSGGTVLRNFTVNVY